MEISLNSMSIVQLINSYHIFTIFFSNLQLLYYRAEEYKK